MSETVDQSVLSVSELLKRLERIAIPIYQRPYKWTLKNVSQLFHDLQTHQDKSAYRLGTVVFHSHQDKDIQCLDIVDGQQRTLTLVLAVWAVIENRLEKLKCQDLRELLLTLKPIVLQFMEKQQFVSQISKQNLHQNYRELRRLVSRSEFSETHIEFLLHKCQVVVFALENVSEAFQFFDSQNARGRDLDPHDLLKAYHLREFPEHETALKAATVAHWESLNSNDLADLFANYLYRIRQWAQGKSARYFGKEQAGLFKGVNLAKVDHFPYVKSLDIAHHFVDDYNNQYQRKVDGQKQAFPFGLDQMIINGRRFFEMAEHYQQQVSAIISNEHTPVSVDQPVIINDEELSTQASEIIKILNSYKARTRTGDQYVRSMFDCAVIFYMDKFGTHGLSSAIEKIFIWAYRCRIKQQAVQLATMDNHVLNSNLFRIIKEARLPNDVLSIPLETIGAADNKNNARSGNAEQDELVNLFRGMSYYE